MDLTSYWTNSINLRADYSDGLSLTNSIRQWSQSVYNATDTTYTRFVYDVPGISEAPHELAIAVTGSSEAIYARYAGCVIIGMMPSDALPETLNSLREVWNFYAEQPVTPEVPQIRSQPVKASITGYKRRPDLVISD